MAAVPRVPARLASLMAFLFLIPLVSFAAHGDDRTGVRPAAPVRFCSDRDTPSDRDFLPILAIRGLTDLFLFKTVLSSFFPQQYLGSCSSSDFGVNWNGWGRMGGGNAILANQTYSADYPDSREMRSWEAWDPGSAAHVLLGDWSSQGQDYPWVDNASAASVAISANRPHFAMLAFQRGSPPSVFFTRSGDYYGFSGMYYNWTTPFVVAGANGPIGPEPSGLPHLSIDPFDRVHLVYLRSDVTGRRDVYYLRNDDRGRDDGWTQEPGRLLSRTTADNHDAVIATSREGDTVVVIWTATPAGGNDDLLYAYSLDGGVTWSPTVNFAATAYHEGNAVIAVDPIASSFHVAYWRDDSTASHDNNILYAQAAWGDPANWTSPQSLVDTGAIVSDTYRRPAITSYWRGGTNHIVTVAWTDLRNGDEDLYMTDLDLLECAASATPASGLAPLSVTFDATASGGMPPYNYSWRFGDGATDAGPSVLYTYAQPGTYDASLLVTDAAGNTCFDGVPIHVLSPLPDLAVLRSEIVFSAPPYLEGSPLAVNAIVHNLGGTSVSNSTVRLALGSPGGPPLGDRTVPSIPSMDNASVSFPWTPASAGTYRLCVVVDPDNTIPESNEGNNAACTSLDIVGRPDLAILVGDVTASPPAVPPGGTVDVNATVRNLGSSPAAGVLVSFFKDENGSGVPDPGESFANVTIPSLPEATTTSLSSTWTANAPGPHTLCAYADPNDTIAEGDGTNNVACTAVMVTGPPDYVPANATPFSPVVFGRSRPRSFSVDVRNVGGAAANATVRLDFFNASTPSSPFASFSVPPLVAGGAAGPFTAPWVSPAVPGTYAVRALVDANNTLVEGNESNNAFTWTVRVVAGPVTTLVVGAPNATTTLTYVTSATPLSYSVFDLGGTGVRYTDYRIDLGPWINYTATGPFRLAAEGTHFLEWLSADNAGNVEAAASALLGVDDTPPVTIVAVGSPKYQGAVLYVSSATPVTLTSADGGVTPVGPASIEYRINGGAWTPYTTAFTLAGADGLRTVEYRATDLLGNAAGGTANVTLDDTPPVTTIAPATGPFAPDTVFTLSATDAGSGVDGIEYRIDGGAWSTYAGGFSLPPGDHGIGFRAIDHLQNAETERMLPVTAERPLIPGGTNWKPLLAALFSAVLALAGAWASVRAPWRSDPRQKVRAFVYTSLPFVATEAATGGISAFTGLLSIPPLWGLGTILDSSILIVGVALALYRVRRRASVT